LHTWTEGKVEQIDSKYLGKKIPFNFTSGKETACLSSGTQASKMLDIMHQTNCSKLYNHSQCMPPYTSKSSRIVFMPSKGSSFQSVEDALAMQKSEKLELAWLVKKSGKTLEPAGMALVLSKQAIATPVGTTL